MSVDERLHLLLFKVHQAALISVVSIASPVECSALSIYVVIEGAESAPITDPTFWVFDIWNPALSSTTSTTIATIPVTVPSITTRVRLRMLCLSQELQPITQGPSTTTPIINLTTTGIVSTTSTIITTTMSISPVINTSSTTCKLFPHDRAKRFHLFSSLLSDRNTIGCVNKQC